jgi:hypothetical protein
MVLDNPAPNPTRDQTDVQTVEELENALKNRAKIARALDRSDVFASAWMFPYAYHIKVIVRDGTAFWLSSGNLNNSNQPDLNAPPLTEDRDWHVIVEDEGLSKTFLAFLNQDYVSARPNRLAVFEMLLQTPVQRFSPKRILPPRKSLRNLLLRQSHQRHLKI